MKEQCQCGHINPEGTELCESCGTQLLFDREVDMRYEGAARRSRSNNRTIIDRIWNFFSSVKVGIIIILLTLISSILGTILPQEHFIMTRDPRAFYAAEHGTVGELFYDLGFTRMYSSWWFKTILGMLAISIIVASLDRVIPLYRALKKQTVKKSVQFLQRQKINATWIETSDVNDKIELIQHEMKKRGYSVRQEGQALLAEKSRFSRWGPYVNHTGLIILITGALLMTSIPGWYLDEFIWVQEGETRHVTGTPYYVKNDAFTIEMYTEEELEQMNAENKPSVKLYKTEATLYEKVGTKSNGEPQLIKVAEDSIIVNDPLRYKGVRLYQADYDLDDWKYMTFSIDNKATGETLGEFTVDLYSPEPFYELENGSKVEIADYFPDFDFDENNKPISLSSTPRNPAFVFTIFAPGAEQGENSWAIIGMPLEEIHQDNIYKANFQNLETIKTSGLKVSMNKGMPMIWIGAAIFLIGVVMGLYWHHRRIWLLFDGQTAYVGAHTNKGWLGMKQEVTAIFESSGQHMSFEESQVGRDSVASTE